MRMATLPDSLSGPLFLCAALWSLRAVGRPAILGGLFLRLGPKLLLQEVIGTIRQRPLLANEDIATEYQTVHLVPTTPVCVRLFLVRSSARETLSAPGALSFLLCGTRAKTVTLAYEMAKLQQLFPACRSSPASRQSSAGPSP